ncbi:GNAT family N-acetyltransferase [Oceanotoga sp. DSM 15011]|uniref:RimJ/RimL family protein N-acetyltransferase n=1 Tax=Oceanotoga teriensis TaxID=515440 RepID=A0AA45C5T0_9BACT|nr:MULTISPECIES: GNAT family protein [Oceanotoga]MDN5341669.1 hypothetical protein [Oceanotoga sp.]MDO7977423.1 GNAT family N-acetyltransferase [Oceanotoga teriensis]PWJ89625.1 RimJ/RimL family protein N-acetyltransferase [Oceanotoga teriensis]UYO98895.1 GNAT family N-acetyltransferase [Oceanotoga sp. DSM 15011]
MLKGDKVILRAYNKDDVKNALKSINDFEVKQYLDPSIPFPLKYEDELKWYERLNPKGDGTYSMAIENLETGEYMGGIGVNSVDWKNSVASIGLFLAKEFWNKGYGTDSLNVLLNFIFNEMNINKVKLNVYDFNKRGIRCYEKVGFVKEGVLREEIYRNGKYNDEIIMGILKSEFKQKNNQE